MGVHNCQKCRMLCADVHPWCLFCRSSQRAAVESLAIRAEALPSPEEVSPVIVREIDAILARHNRQEARARRRSRPLPWGRLTGFFLVGLGTLGLLGGTLQVCVWIAQGVIAWTGGR